MNNAASFIQPTEAHEGMTAEHKFYGTVTIIQTRNAYQGMVRVRLADGTEKSALLGDMVAA